MLLLSISLARAAAPGTSYVEYAPGANGWTTSSINVSMVGSLASNEAWFVLEYLPQLNLGVGTATSLFYQSSSLTTPPSLQLLQVPGQLLVGEFMYPSIATQYGGTYVYATSKESQNQAVGHLRVWTQDRYNFLSLPTYEPVTGVNTNKHGRNELNWYDYTRNDYYLCWTRTATDDDAWSKQKNASTWLASADRSISATAGIVEDHCIQDFTYVSGSGATAVDARYVVFHKDVASGDDLRIKITTWNGTTWTDTTTPDFTLTGSAGANFPYLYRGGSSAGTNTFVVAAQHSSGIKYWKCVGTTTQCDSSAEFGSATTVLPGVSYWDPKVVIANRGLFSTTWDEFVFWQIQGQDHKIHVATNCAGAGTWVDKGEIPVPVGYKLAYNGTDSWEDLGAMPSSSSPQTWWDTTNVHLSFLAQADVGSTAGGFRQLDMLHYVVATSALCP